MARRDDILNSFLAHEIILNKYKIKAKSTNTVKFALESNETIVKTLALIVDSLESKDQIKLQ
jgi:hypothetical protein